jgi:hypothetical protein
VLTPWLTPPKQALSKLSIHMTSLGLCGNGKIPLHESGDYLVANLRCRTGLASATDSQAAIVDISYHGLGHDERTGLLTNCNLSTSWTPRPFLYYCTRREWPHVVCPTTRAPVHVYLEAQGTWTTSMRASNCSCSPYPLPLFPPLPIYLREPKCQR